MSLGELEEPWGQLVSTELPPGAEEERVPVLGSTFLIGRAKEADLVISGNQLVSSRHCLLHRDEEGGKWVSDTSTNGTLLNNKRLEKNKKVKLSDGDILGVVFRKDNPESNVVYKFQDLRPQSQSTEEGTQELTQEVGCGERVDGEEGSRDRVVGKRKEMEGDDIEDAPSVKKLSLSTDKREVEVLQEDVRSEAAPAATPVAMVKADSIEQTLICQICQEIFHDCISLQPCMHCYCSGCYSDWMSLSNECPTCRGKVERISKNHLVNNLVDAFLRANPERKRKEEDLKELDEKNKITRDMLYPKRRRHRHYDDDDDSEDDPDRSMSGGGSSSDSDSSLPSPLRFTHVHFTLGDPSSIVASRAPPFTCRQCPGFIGVHHHSSHPPPPPFTCSLSTNHVLCMCCLQPMPDRRLETDVTIPPQTCELCGKAFCHMYWGCSKPGCSGCLGIFRGKPVWGSGLLHYLIYTNVKLSSLLLCVYIAA
jgi:E3 ubiquitin-protein ligase CHFR